MRTASTFEIPVSLIFFIRKHFTKHFNFIFNWFLCMKGGWGERRKKNVEKLFIGARKCRNNGEKFSGKRKKNERAEKKLFHTFLYFNSCKIINFFTATWNVWWNNVGYSKINTLNGVSNKKNFPATDGNFCSFFFSLSLFLLRSITQ